MTQRPWMPSIAVAVLLATGCFDLKMPDSVDAGTLACGGGRYDPASGLCWQHPTNNQQYGWQDAIDYCGGLDLAGYTDWRLPGIEELLTLFEECNVDLAGSSGGYCRSCFDSETCRALFSSGDDSGNNGGWGNPWSSSSCSAFPSCAWSVDFSNGTVNTNDSMGNMLGARCVRGEADVDTETDTDIAGLGEACTNGGGECAELEASFCVYDPLGGGEGVCTITGCSPGACPAAYNCCDCTGASYFFENLCAPDEMVGALSVEGCACE
jgi:hypothetical protein